MAMKKAVMQLLEVSGQQPSTILTDAMPLNLADTHFHEIPVYYFTQGESRSSSIAAASIVAKVTRDAMMKLYDEAIPGYGWSDNKGYGTTAHRAVIKEQQHSFLHRMTFLQKLLQPDYSEEDKQLSIPSSVISALGAPSQEYSLD
jgi:ribonuclease HII